MRRRAVGVLVGIAAVVVLAVVVMSVRSPDGARQDGLDLATPLERGGAQVADGDVVVLRADGSMATVNSRGDVTGSLSGLPAGIGEAESIVVDPSGAVVLVAAVKQDDDQPKTCDAVALQLTAEGTWRKVAEGAGLALSADGDQLAYFTYATVDGFCRRTALVVRDLTTGSESTVVELDNGPLHGNPPDWPVTWSPDGSAIAHVSRTGVVVTQVATGDTAPATSAEAESSLAPAWFADGTLVFLDGCCIGDATVRRAMTGEAVFDVPGPVRSIRAARSGPDVWITIEEGRLLRWDGKDLHELPVDALLSSG